MSNGRLFLDIHAIQVLPPSNVNRDDTGSPKTARYGGVVRARVSSQSWKKVMRDYFCENGQNFQMGIRTNKILNHIIKKILDNGYCDKDEAREKAIRVLENAGYKYNSQEDKLEALYFFSNSQIEKLAEATTIEKFLQKVTGPAQKKMYKELASFLKEEVLEIDIALFGRMLANNPELNEDASSQVAHAISTHEVQTEYDYFTAGDDLADKGNAGAAMIETNEFNSSTLYRYANVAVHEFLKQMHGDKDLTARALRLYLEAFANSMPTGKSNSYANQTLPQALLIELRDDRPISLVSAYENPVKAKNGYTEESVKRLFVEANRANKFVHKPIASFCLLANDAWYPAEAENAFEGVKEDGVNSLLDDFSKELIKIM